MDRAPGGNWNTAGNWNLVSGSVGLGYPNLTGDIAQFTKVTGSAQTATVNVAGLIVGEIDFGTSDNVTIAGANALTLTPTSGNAIIDTVGSNTGTDLISAALTQTANLNVAFSGGSLNASNLTFASNATDTITGTSPVTLGTVKLNGADVLSVGNTGGGTTLTGNITNTAGTDTLTVSGAGVLNLPNAITDANGTTLSGGTLNVGNNAAPGASALTLTSGTIEASTAGIVLANPLTFNATGSLTIGGPTALGFSGGVTLSGANIITDNNSLTTFSGVIGPATAQSLTLTTTGAGTVALTGANTFTGGVTLTSGVIVNAGNAAAFALGTITATSGTILASAAVTLANPLTFSAGGSLTIGGTNAVTLSTNAITLNGTNTLTLNDAGSTILSAHSRGCRDWHARPGRHASPDLAQCRDHRHPADDPQRRAAQFRHCRVHARHQRHHDQLRHDHGRRCGHDRQQHHVRQQRQPHHRQHLRLDLHGQRHADRHGQHHRHHRGQLGDLQHGRCLRRRPHRRRARDH